MRSNDLPAKAGETIMVTRHGRVVARVDRARHPVTAEGVRQRYERVLLSHGEPGWPGGHRVAKQTSPVLA